MSKKMMKRSLVLGALMAFVITGSAMAAETGYSNVTSDLKDLEIVNFIGTGVSNDKGIDVRNGKTLTVSNIGTITINGVYKSNDPSARYSGNVFYALNGGNLVFEKIGTLKTEDSIQGAMIFQANGNGSTISVNADTIDLRNYNYGILAHAGATVELNAKDITMMSKESTTIYCDYAGKNNGPRNTVSIVADENVNIYSGKYVVCTWSNEVTGSDVLIKGKNITIDADYNNDGVGYVVYGRKNSVTNIEAAVTANIKGDIDAKDTSVVNIKLGTNGSFNGAIDKADTSTVNIDLGSGSTMDVSSGAGEQKVTSLKGTGTVAVGDDDKLVVKTNEANLTVQVAGVTADNVAVDDQQDKLDSLVGKVVDENDKDIAKTFAIAEGEVVGAVTAEVTADGKAGKAVEAVNTVNQAIGEAAVNFKAHYRAHMNDMNKRMGELRMANGETGVWTRMVRGENEFEGAKSQYNQYQLGYDEKLSVDKRWTVGAAVTFAEGTGNFSQGSTEDDSTAFAIYGSKLNNDGTFVDLIARYARLESDITMGDYKADYSTNGYSVSAEFGKRIQQGKGFWIEPQVELTYGSVDSAEYTINGKDVNVGDMDSLIGRVGFSLGKDIKQGNVYARASYLYDFDGETDTTFGKNGVTRTIEEDLGGGWWEVGVGANISLSKATYIYADIEKTFGGEIDTNWQWNLGVRYSF